MNRIYIIGPVGSGKSTLGRFLSKKYNINYYELDKVVWDDDNGNIKRSNEEIDLLFHNIINKKNWIIEDVGRKKFRDGIINADIVYYIKLSKFTNYKRCILRWIKQLMGLESYNYRPTIKSLFDMLGWVKLDFNNMDEKIEYIKNNSKKYEILLKKDLKKIYNK